MCSQLKNDWQMKQLTNTQGTCFSRSYENRSIERNSNHVRVFPNSFVRAHVGLFARLFVRSFVRSFVCLFVRLFVCLFVRSSVCLFVRFFVCLFVRLFVRSVDLSFVRSFSRWFVRSYIRSFVLSNGLLGEIVYKLTVFRTFTFQTQLILWGKQTRLRRQPYGLT